MNCKETMMPALHYSDVIMGAMAPQITSITIVCSSAYSAAHQRKHQSSASLAFLRGNHRRSVNSPKKRASNAENVSIWWRHHGRLLKTGARTLTHWLHLMCFTKGPTQSNSVSWSFLLFVWSFYQNIHLNNNSATVSGLGLFLTRMCSNQIS